VATIRLKSTDDCPASLAARWCRRQMLLPSGDLFEQVLKGFGFTAGMGVKKSLQFSAGIDSDTAASVELPTPVCCGLEKEPVGTNCCQLVTQTASIKPACSQREGGRRSGQRELVGTGGGRTGEEGGCRVCCPRRRGIFSEGTVRLIGTRGLGGWRAGQERPGWWCLKSDWRCSRLRFCRTGCRFNQIDRRTQDQVAAGGTDFWRDLVRKHRQKRHHNHADEKEKRTNFHRWSMRPEGGFGVNVSTHKG